MTIFKRLALFVPLFLLLVPSSFPPAAGATPPPAATPSAAWSIQMDAEPTNFNAADAQDDVRRLTVTATGGTYALRPAALSGEEATAPIEWDASAEAVQQALEDLPGVGAGNVTVAGGPGDSGGSKPYTITWVGALSGQNIGYVEVQGGALNGSAVLENVQEAKAQDGYAVSAINDGSRVAVGGVTVTDRLPAGVVPTEIKGEEPISGLDAECSLKELKCTYSEPVLPGNSVRVWIYVAVTSAALKGPLVNSATVSGGSGGEVSASTSNLVNVGPAPFGLVGFDFASDNVEGSPDLQAGDHPYALTTTIELNTVHQSVRGLPVNVAQDAKDIEVELPLGFSGDPLAAERCPEILLNETEGDAPVPGYHTLCPVGSQVGTVNVMLSGGRDEKGAFSQPFPVYNVVPEHGYPAELGVNAGLGQPVFLYADVVHSPSGYRLRVATPGILRGLGAETEAIRFTIFGDPGAVNGAGGNAAFVTSPTGCTTQPLKTHVYVTSWEGGEASEEATAYPEVSGCNLLQGAAAFDPNFAVEPETTQADTPSGYTMDLKLPQAPSVFGALATPDLKNATITLPVGVSISPAAASGPDALSGCQATGREGINIGSSDVASDGQDLGDPEATELGAGHPGGDGSPYDDGLYHTAPGHCPENSRLGEVEARTPDLAESLHGHMYLMDPLCGHPVQPPCSEAEAEEGKVFHICLELSGSGVIVKLEGRIEVGGNGQYSKLDGLAPGQLRISFDETPQFPLEEVKVTLPGGPRAGLASPQACGTATTETVLEPSSAPQSGANATPSSSFQVGGCSGAFKPGFVAGTATTNAGGYSPFVLQLSRQDGEQDLSGLEVTLPKGLLAKLSGVAECGETEASAGTCSSASEIGTVTATVGAGSEPLRQTGKIYLTGPYNGGPFGEVVVVPAVAGPFNFGNVVVRGSIRINPETAQASIVSNPFPTVVDGVLIRLRSVDAEINRAGFVFNPTDCASQAVTGTVTGVQGASEAVSSPFAVAGCADLPFKPVFTTSTQGKTSRVDGASLTVKVTAKPGEANIHKVHLQFPKVLPARLATLRKACTEAQFAANPAGCPAASAIGTGTVVTPVLSTPLTGPAYLVSHGGAAYPDVVFVFQGDGVKIDLTGGTDIKKGVTYSTFESVPDAPITSFESKFPEGPDAIFGTDLPAKVKGSFCGRTPVIPTTLEGQNGTVNKESIKLAITGCPRHKVGKGNGKTHKPHGARHKKK
jgi:hypothetical protein